MKQNNAKFFTLIFSMLGGIVLAAVSAFTIESAGGTDVEAMFAVLLTYILMCLVGLMLQNTFD